MRRCPFDAEFLTSFLKRVLRPGKRRPPPSMQHPLTRAVWLARQQLPVLFRRPAGLGERAA